MFAFLSCLAAALGDLCLKTKIIATGSAISSDTFFRALDCKSSGLVDISV